MIDPYSCVGKRSTPSNPTWTVSFIQVCRNHLRSGFQDILSSQSYLRWLYASGCAMYAYQGCPAIDMLAAIRHLEGHSTSVCYYPMLISIKSRRWISSSEITSAIDAMKDAIGDRCKKALCLLLLVGLDNPKRYELDCKLQGGELDSVASQVICVPSDDPFGLSSMVQNTTTEGSCMAEVFASHSFLYPLLDELGQDKWVESFLRAKPCSEDQVKTARLGTALMSVKCRNKQTN